MAERVQLTAKASEAKKENSASRTIGNQAVQRLIKSGALQAKLKIGQPGDRYEQEADRVAEQVMQMPEPRVQRQPIEEEEEEQIQTKQVTEQITPLVQRQVEEEEEEQVQTKPVTGQIAPLVQRQVVEEEEEQVQTKPVTGQFTPLVQRQDEEEEELRKQPIEEEEDLQAKTTSGRIPGVQPNIESNIQSLKGGGQPLSENDRAFFESRFGRDFSQVRVHADTQAAETARGMNARAFTVGNNVVFGGDESQLASSSSQHLLAHELVHVVQQEGQATRIDRTPEDKARLNKLPLSASKTRGNFQFAFNFVYTEAKETIPNFEGRIKSLFMVIVKSLNLDAGQRGAVNKAAYEIASIIDGLNIAGIYMEFNLARALKKLHELMPSNNSNIKLTSYGFEYMKSRLVKHSAEFVAVSLQEHAHGAEIAADPALLSVAARSGTSFLRLCQDLTHIIEALSNGQSLLMLELEALVQELVNLRNQYSPSDPQDLQRENQLERSDLARRAVLVNNKLLELMDSGNATTPTPLDESVKDILSKIRKTAQSEEKTLEALGDRKSLLAAQPLNLGVRVDDPYFKESGLSEEVEALQIQPGHAFPKTTARIMTDTQRELADRINKQSDMLQEQMNKIVPPHKDSKYNLKEFAQVYKHWFGLLGIEKEKMSIARSGVLQLWQGIHSATAIGTLSYSGDMMTAWLRYYMMQQALPLLGLFVSTGIDREFNRVIDMQRLRRSQTLSGKSASDARYEFAELYDKQTRSRWGEEASRFNVGTQQSKKTAEKFSSVAKLPKFLQTQGAFQLNVTPQPLPIQGLRTVEAKEGWSYLVEIPDYFSGRTIAYEHKVATPEVAEYLLAYRQHVRTLRPHSAKVRVPSPKKQGYTMVQKPVGGSAFEGAPSAQKGILDRADLQARKSIGMPSRLCQDQPAHGSVLVQKALMDYLDYFFKQSDPALRMAAIFHIMNVEHKIGKVFVKMLEPEEIAKVLGMAFGMGFGLSVLGRLGPIGQILSVGIGKGMKVSGGSDITAALTVAAFLKEASSVENFTEARMMGYIGLPIVMDIKQLFESAISAPAAMAGQKAADATITFVINRINKKPPATIAEAAELGRQIAQASPEARQDMLAAIDSYLADLQAQGVGKNQSNQDYDIMIAFRNSLKSQSTIDQALDPFTTKLKYETPEKSKFPFVDPNFRLRTAGERAKLLEAMGDLAGKVQLIEDPTLTGKDRGTVRVYYSGRKVRIHVGMEATAKDIKFHMPVVHTLRKYEGVLGGIRILVRRALYLIGIRISQHGTLSNEAKLEIQKLKAIRDDLLAQQDAIDLNARRLIDKDISRDVIDQHIIDIQKQILEHMRNLDSMEAGVGFIAARKKSAGTLKLETKMKALDKAATDTAGAIKDLKETKLRSKEVSELRTDPATKKELAKLEAQVDALERKRLEMQEEVKDVKEVAKDPEMADLAGKEVELLRQQLEDHKAEANKIKKQIDEKVKQYEKNKLHQEELKREAEAKADEAKDTANNICDETDGTNRPEASVGDGSTEAILREEIKTGEPIKSSEGHHIKTKEALNGLEKALPQLNEARPFIDDPVKLKAIYEVIARAKDRIEKLQPALEEWNNRVITHSNKFKKNGESRVKPGWPTNP